MSTRGDLIYALKRGLADPDKADLLEKMLRRLVSRLDEKDVLRLRDAFDDGGVDLFEIILDRVLTERGE
jgi:hypothetical protein